MCQKIIITPHFFRYPRKRGEVIKIYYLQDIINRKTLRKIIKESARQTIIKTLEGTRYEDLIDILDIHNLQRICWVLDPQQIQFEDFTPVKVFGYYRIYIDGIFYNDNFNPTDTNIREDLDFVILTEDCNINGLIRGLYYNKEVFPKIIKKITENF